MCVATNCTMSFYSYFYVMVCTLCLVSSGQNKSIINFSYLVYINDYSISCIVTIFLGAGIVTGFPYHNKVIAHFVGDKNSARLNCTVMNGDVQTDTVWSIRYKGSEQIQRVQNNDLFQISGNRRRSSLESNFNYGNYMNIVHCFVKELDGAIIFCGSYMDLTQVNVTLLDYVCGK